MLLNGFGDAGEIERLRRDISDECGVRTAYSGADMSKPDQIAGMVEQATAELGRVDILVNNAGIQHTAPVQDFPADRWDAIIAINLSAAFHATQGGPAADAGAQLGPDHQHRQRARPRRQRPEVGLRGRRSTASSA